MRFSSNCAIGCDLRSIVRSCIMKYQMACVYNYFDHQDFLSLLLQTFISTCESFRNVYVTSHAKTYTIAAFRLQAVCQLFEWLGYPLARNINPLERFRHPFAGNINPFERLGYPS